MMPLALDLKMKWHLAQSNTRRFSNALSRRRDNKSKHRRNEDRVDDRGRTSIFKHKKSYHPICIPAVLSQRAFRKELQLSNKLSTPPCSRSRKQEGRGKLKQ
uniref:Uncharacterized protein n=1 Tax=Calcidiscus leptoporus TaxID=127549 RepID=A0A7S0NWA0_9EUKA